MYSLLCRGVHRTDTTSCFLCQRPWDNSSVDSSLICIQVPGQPACSQPTAIPGLMTWTSLVPPADPPCLASVAATHPSYPSRTGHQHCNPLAVTRPPKSITLPPAMTIRMRSMRCIRTSARPEVSPVMKVAAAWRQLPLLLLAIQLTLLVLPGITPARCP